MDYKNLMDLYKHEVDKEEVPEYFDQEPAPAMMQGVPYEEEAIDEANDVVEAPNAYDQVPEPAAPVMEEPQPQQIPQPQTPPEVGMEGIDQAQAAVNKYSKDSEKNTQPIEEEEEEKPLSRDEQLAKLVKEFKASREDAKSEERGNREQAKLEDAFRLMNKSLAGRGGLGAPDLGPSAVSQLPKTKDTSYQDLMAQYKLLGGDKKELSKMDKAKLKTEEMKQDELKSKSVKRKEDKKIKQEEIKIKQAKEKRASDESDRELQATLDLADSKISKIDELKEKLKKGGVTGLWDAFPAAAMDAMRGGDDYNTRKDLQEVAVDQTLLKTAQTKGAISDAEMALFKSPVPSMVADEKVWIKWLDKVQKAQRDIKQRLQSGKTATGKNDMGDTVRVQAPNGKVKVIPRDKLEQAIAAGGKEI
jgi:hypothetical protein